MGDKIRVGRHDGKIQKMLYEKVVLPAITYNMESTTNMTQTKKWRNGEMEMIQGKMENIQRTSINPILGFTD